MYVHAIQIIVRLFDDIYVIMQCPYLTVTSYLYDFFCDYEIILFILFKNTTDYPNNNFTFFPRF